MVNYLELTKSKLRRKILVYFFTNPESYLYLREIANRIDEDPGNLSKELTILSREGIFNVENKGTLKFFQLNKDYPLYEELDRIIFKTSGVEGSLKKIVTKLINIEIAFIFGSYAQGEQDSISDVDLMIIGNPNEDKLISKIGRLENQIGREINYHIFSQTDWRRKIKNKDPFVDNILQKKKVYLIGDDNGLSKIS